MPLSPRAPEGSQDLSQRRPALGAVPADPARATYAVVLAGGRGTRLQQLTAHRAKPAMPFGGKFKIIDFALSNCLNSGIRRIGVLTQYKSQGLIRHLSRGWGFLDAGLGEYVDILPAQQKIDESWYCGTADAVYQNLDVLYDADPRLVLVLAADHVYKMDYRILIADHLRERADATVACIEVPTGQACAFGVVRTNAEGRIVAFEEKPQHPSGRPGRPDLALASMGVYVFNAEFLYRELRRDAADRTSQHDFGCDILPAAVARARVQAHEFARSCVGAAQGCAYWRDVGTLDAYWSAHMDLICDRPDLDLYDDSWPIRSRPDLLPPAKFIFDPDGRQSMAIEALVAGGCIVRGASVRRSVLFSKVVVGEGSVVEDSLLLPGTIVGRQAVVRRAIIDKHCILPDGIRIGVHPADDRARFTVTEGGVTLVTPDMLAQGLRLRA